MPSIYSKQRNSGIELLKLVAIFLIMLNHVVLDVCNDHSNTFNYISSSTSIANVILVIFKYSGSIGNAIFLISSCWFLVDSKKNKNKESN